MQRTERKKLLDSLHKVKVKTCCYRSAFGELCDCKYIGDASLKEIENVGTEKTGCAEISLVIFMLENMTDEDFKKFSTFKHFKQAE